MSITQTECVFVALSIRHGMCILYVVICGLNMKCVFRLSLQRLSEIFFILKGTERDPTYDKECISVLV